MNLANSEAHIILPMDKELYIEKVSKDSCPSHAQNARDSLIGWQGCLPLGGKILEFVLKRPMPVDFYRLDKLVNN